MATASGEAINPTPQQTAILNSTGRRVRINARAGTGKTTTLRLLAERLVEKNKKGLYLVYNRRSCQEARAKLRGVPRVSVYTVHSFALKSVPDAEAIKSSRRCNLDPVSFLAEYEALGEGRQRLAVVTARFGEYFLNSTHTTLDKGAEAFARDELRGALQAEFLSHSRRIVGALRKLMKLWLDGEEACPHDFYLKMAHKKGWLLRSLEQFDVLLVDEAQDLSPVMLDCVGQFKGRAFVVGDSHQQIYDFRYAVDALTRLQHDEEHDLSLSFRFGKEIAGLATSFIGAACKERVFLIDGNPKRTSRVLDAETAPRRLPPGSAIIARTNTSLFEEAARMLGTGQAFVFSRDLGSILDRAVSVYGVWSHQRRLVTDRLLRSFADVETLRQHAEALDDRELLLLIGFAESHRDATLGLLARLRQVPTSDECPADAVMLTTVHGAKGLEFDEVRLCGDIFVKLKGAMTKHRDELDAEINLTYVAITRARFRLYLPKAAMDLPIKWLQPAPGASASTTGKTAKPAGQVASTSPGSARKRADNHPGRSDGAPPTSSPRRATVAYPLGSRVQTPGYGRGTVVKVAEGKRRVKLDGAPAQIWVSVSQLRA